MPYCNTITFPELSAEDYVCESTSAYTMEPYYTDYVGDTNPRRWAKQETTITSSTTSTTSTTSTVSISSLSSISSSSSSTSVSSSSPLPVPTPSPSPKSHTGAIVGSVVGVVAAVVAGAVVTFVYMKKRKQRRFDNSIPEVAQM